AKCNLAHRSNDLSFSLEPPELPEFGLEMLSSSRIDIEHDICERVFRATIDHLADKKVVFRGMPLRFRFVTKTFADLNFPGRLIAVEGLDGSGKSTQIYLLKRWLEQQGLKVFFSEWNSSQLVKAATSKGKKRELLSPTTFSLIHATDFADRYERQLVPLLRAGYLVLCDRYIFTAFARDVVRGCPPEWVRGLYNFAALPDMTFFFKANLEVSLQRILDNRPQLKYFEAGMDLRLSTDPYASFKIFQGRILEQYLAMSTEFKFTIIDANQPVEAQQNIVRDLVSANIDFTQYTAPKFHS
ncbi:MAG: dTMP kinase, partial [Limisphaerales bacterium]